MTVAHNRVEDHDGVGGSTLDLAISFDEPGDGLGTCFAGNGAAATQPADPERTLPCPATPVALDATEPVVGPSSPPGRDYREIPPPGPQPAWPGALDAPAPPIDADRRDAATVTVPHRR